MLWPPRITHLLPESQGSFLQPRVARAKVSPGCSCRLVALDLVPFFVGGSPCRGLPELSGSVDGSALGTEAWNIFHVDCALEVKYERAAGFSLVPSKGPF